MNKSMFIDAIHEKIGGTKKTAEELVDAIFDTITGALKEGKEVSITGFGTFSAKERKARQARNPRTGESVFVPARKAPKFKAAKGLKDAVRQ